MNSLYFTLLEKNQLLGNNQLEIFKEMGIQARISDYAILSGGYIFGIKIFYIGDEYHLENRPGCYWTKTANEYKVPCSVAPGFDYGYVSSNRHVGIRPALSFASISNICLNSVRTEDGILEVEYGEYPGQAASKNLQNILEGLYQSGSLSKTGKYYTRDKTTPDQNEQKFQEEQQEEYEYQGKKYIRVRANSCYNRGEFTLSNGEQYKNGDYVWIEVQPIKWLVDETKNIAVAEKILFAGVQFENTSNYNGNFESTNLYWYLNTYFVKDIIPSKIEEKNKTKIQNITLKMGTIDNIIKEINSPIQLGTSTILTLPEYLINSINSLTIRSIQDKTNQVVYVKKR